MGQPGDSPSVRPGVEVPATPTSRPGGILSCLNDCGSRSDNRPQPMLARRVDMAEGKLNAPTTPDLSLRLNELTQTVTFLKDHVMSQGQELESRLTAVENSKGAQAFIDKTESSVLKQLLELELSVQDMRDSFHTRVDELDLRHAEGTAVRAKPEVQHDNSQALMHKLDPLIREAIADKLRHVGHGSTTNVSELALQVEGLLQTQMKLQALSADTARLAGSLDEKQRKLEAMLLEVQFSPMTAISDSRPFVRMISDGSHVESVSMEEEQALFSVELPIGESDQPVGLELKKERRGQSMLVEAIMPGSRADIWNLQQPDLGIRAGDVLVAVNGRTATNAAVEEELSSPFSSNVSLTFRSISRKRAAEKTKIILSRENTATEVIDRREKSREGPVYLL